MKYDLAPLVLFVYNRLDTTKKTIENLKKNTLAKDTDLFIFSDAAKNDSGKEKVQNVRDYIHKITGFRSIKIVEAEKNKGLANSVITGVTDIIVKYGKVIVVEDDLLTAPQFLQFMNDALEFYKEDRRIWSISGYQYPIKMPAKYNETVYASYRASSWGWATWLDRWESIDWLIGDYKKYRYNPIRILSFCKGGTDLDKMLRYQMQGKLDSWAIRWCYNQSRQNKYTIYPVKSLVDNIGTDGSGTHCDPTSFRFHQTLAYDFKYQFKHMVKPNYFVMRNFRGIVNRSIIRKIKNKLRAIR